MGDNIPPGIVCPANITLSANANCSSLLGTYSALSVSDNCNPNPGVTQNPVAATVLNGHNDAKTVTLTANDGNGNTATCTFSVTLKDVTPPSITCPANTTVTANGSCSGVVGAYSAVSVGDNCAANPVVTQSLAASTILTGHNDFKTVTLTANDGNGNTATCTFSVTLKDVTPPAITCPANTTVAANAGCSGVIGAYSAVSVSDNCAANPMVSQSPVASTVLSGHNDTKTVTLTADDGHGNTAACTFSVTLKDVTPPAITCPVNTTVAANGSCSGMVGAYSANSVSDNCTPNPAVTQSPVASTVLSGHNDTKTVTLTADDGHGNTAFCTFSVTLKDLTPPAITCPANTTVAANGSCSGVVGAYSAVSVSDNCTPNPTVTQSPVASTVLSGHNDVKTVTLTADDGHGNTAFCTFSVTLKDVTPPSITCPANTTVAANASCSGVVGAYSAVSVGDNCAANPVVTQSPVATTVLSGHNDAKTVTLTANDGNGNTATCTFSVTLKDVTPPSITCPANTTVAANSSCSGVIGAYPAVSVSDNCTVNPLVTQSPVASTVLSGHNDAKTVTLTADDGHGNTTSCTFTVTLKDITPPTVVCKPFTAALNTAGAVVIATADVFQSGADNCGQVNQASVVPNAFNCTNLGPNTVVLTVNDGNGNTATCSAIVSVVDLLPPVMSCNPLTVALNAQGNAGITTAQINNNSSDNCSIVSLLVVPASFTCANLGPNTVTMTGTDQSNNSASCQSTVTVIDNIAPTMICQNVILNLDNTGQATLLPGQVNNGSFDNCVIINLTLSQTLFTCANLGNNTVTLTGRDQSNNTATCTAIIAVKDLIPPVAKCKNVTANLNSAGTVTVPAANVNNGSTDNCTFTLTLTPAMFTCGNLGINIVVLKATDNSGNTNTCTAQVLVKDVSPPTALCKNFTVFLNEFGQATMLPSQIDNGSSDNCTITTKVASQTTFNCSDIAAPVNVFLTVTDPSGNSAACTSLITVKDIIPPTAICQNTSVVLTNGSVTVYGSVLAHNSYDNCSVTTYLPVAKTYTTPGVFNLPITVKDWSGNSASCTSVVTVTNNFNNASPALSLFKGPGNFSLVKPQLNLSLFPNPASGNVHLAFDLPAEQTYRVLLLDLSGKMMLHQEGVGEPGKNIISLSIDGLSPGLYLVDLRSEQLQALHRLMIQR